MRVPTHEPFAPLPGLLRAWVADGRIPGAVVAVGRSTGPVFLHATGCRALEPHRERMTTGTIFDLAGPYSRPGYGIGEMSMVPAFGISADIAQDLLAGT